MLFKALTLQGFIYTAIQAFMTASWGNAAFVVVWWCSRLREVFRKYIGASDCDFQEHSPMEGFGHNLRLRPSRTWIPTDRTRALALPIIKDKSRHPMPYVCPKGPDPALEHCKTVYKLGPAPQTFAKPDSL